MQTQSKHDTDSKINADDKSDIFDDHLRYQGQNDVSNISNVQTTTNYWYGDERRQLAAIRINNTSEIVLFKKALRQGCIL